MPVSKRLAESLQWGEEEVTDLAAQLLDHKVFTYHETLVELADAQGADLGDFELSDGILRALRAESETNARRIVETYNHDLAGFLARNDHLPRDLLLSTYDAWADSRAQARAELIAISEAYPAAADATLAFAAANSDGEPLFDFGGHPGDDDPACEVCQALVETSPHPLSRVVEVGSPHLGCRQSWHQTGEREAREQFVVPDAPAGIIGTDPLVNRHGNDHAAAAEAVLALSSQ